MIFFYIITLMNDFLIATKEDFEKRNICEVDFVFVSGDGYVDHPSFAAALLGRLLESHGFSVAILAQPDWKNPDSFKIFGKPRLAFLVSSGAMDSMVSNYLPDQYQPFGVHVHVVNIS